MSSTGDSLAPDLALSALPRVNDGDAAAIDALVDAGWDVSGVDLRHRSRAERILSLLDPLGRVRTSEPAVLRAAVETRDSQQHPVAGSTRGTPGVASTHHAKTGTRADRVLAMLDESASPFRADRHDPASIAGRDANPVLCEEDTRAAEAWMTTGYRAAAVHESIRQRVARHESIAALLHAGSARSSRSGLTHATDPRKWSPDLADRTARLVQLVGDSESLTLAPIPIERGLAGGFERGSTGDWLRRRFWDSVSVAAVLLIAASVLWPMLLGLRQRSTEIACRSNLQSVASAMSSYAGDFHDSMPVVVASLGPSRWWDVNADKPVANSSNIFTLARSGYTRLASLACGGNRNALTGDPSPSQSDWHSLAEISYSYQLMFGNQRPRWSASSQRLVLADRSPAVLRAVSGQSPDACENSPNHRRLGQHGLFTDGSAKWLDSPRVDGDDCIWLPKPRVIRLEGQVQQSADGVTTVILTGKELPRDEADVFLGP